MHAKMAAYVYDTISTIFGFKTIKYSYRLDVIQHFFFSSSYDSLLPISVTRIKHALHKMFERLFWLMAEMPTRLQHNILAMVLHPTTSIEQETKKDKKFKKTSERNKINRLQAIIHVRSNIGTQPLTEYTYRSVCSIWMRNFALMF